MHGVIGRKSNFQASPRGTCDLVKGPSTLLPARSNRHFYFQPSFEYPFNNGKQRNHLRLNLSKWIDRFCYAFLHLVIIGGYRKEWKWINDDILIPSKTESRRRAIRYKLARIGKLLCAGENVWIYNAANRFNKRPFVVGNRAITGSRIIPSTRYCRFPRFLRDILIT